MRSWLARLVSAEVRQLSADLVRARSDRDRATRAAVRWYRAALIHKARADALAANNTEESTTWQ